MKLITTVSKSTMLAVCMAFIAPLLLTGCPSGGDGISGTTLTNIAITPAAVTVARGQAIRFTATGSYVNGATADITSQVTWTSANTSIASIGSSSGVATGVAVGSTTVTASASGVTSPGASLAVSAAVLTRISITPTKQSTLVGTPVTYSATGTYSDGSSGDVTGSVTWTSSNTAVATMDPSGAASALAQGNTTINASANGVTSNDGMLTVKALTAISINPPAAVVAQGLTTHFTATGTYSDGTVTSVVDISNQVSWASASTGIATIDSSTGIATGVALGSANITASASGITSSPATLTVSNALLTGISIAPTSVSTPKGKPVTFTATGSYTGGGTADISGSVIWASTNTSVATINGSGIASSLMQGSTTVTASAKGLSSNSATLTVTAPELTAISISPASTTVPKWLSTNFTATGTYTDGTAANITTQVTWATADSALATINPSTGVAKAGLTVGSTTITASAGVITSSATLNITEAVLTGVSIAPKISSSPKGTPVTYNATGTFSDTTSNTISGSVNWTSSNPAVATIDGSGKATTLTQGNTTVTATVNVPGGGTVTDSAVLTVSAPALTAISITPTTASVSKGLTTNFAASGTYTDGTTADITSQVSWVSANTGFATINSSTGVATGVALGSANITASASGIASSAATLSVTTAVLTGISITPTAPVTPKGTPVAFTATGNYSDTSSANLSGSVIWSSSNTAVATINGSGDASSLAQGSTTVTASAGGITSNSATLTVAAAELVSIAIAPSPARVTLGGTQQFTAIGTYTDTTTANITAAAAWLSSAPGVATIGSATGLATTLSAGSTNISASVGSITSNLAGLVVPLAAPSGLIAVAAPGQVTLSWSPVSGATSYNIYWGNTSGIVAGTTSEIPGLASPYVHSPLSNGNTYYYHVSAVNAATHEEVFSTETFAFLYNNPGNPGNPQGLFSNTASPLKYARVGHISTLLSSGKVLVSAGRDASGNYLANSEIYDPLTNGFSDTGSLLIGRAYASDTLLPNGKVLVIGGRNPGYLSSAELYDPVTGMFAATGSMASARANHTATLLANGKVLVTGGWNGTADVAGAELYDPATGIFTPTGILTNARHSHAATLLADGRVLVTDGCNTQYCVGGELATAELYDPATGIFTPTGSATIKRHGHTATLLPPPYGKVIIIGGTTTDVGQVERSETYDPVTGTFSPTAVISDNGEYRSAILLSNGKVLVMPCGCGATPLGAHLYDPATDSFTLTGTSNGLQFQNSVLLANGHILLTGGQTAATPPVVSNNAEYFY